MLVVDGLTRHFGSLRVLDGLDLRLGPGERVALCGPNGSGKSTALRCVLGTLRPTGGSVSVGGHPAGTPAARRLIGWVPSHDRSFYGRLTGWANLVFAAKLRGFDRDRAAERVAELEGELDLGAVLARRLDRCSTGMAQRLSVARALIAEPPLLLLDEPTRSLDREAIDLFWAALDRRAHAAVVIATHRPEDMERCGRIVELGRAWPGG